MTALRLPLKSKWFEMTKAGIKSEDYREINEYWIKRLVKYCSNMSHLINQPYLIQLNRFEVEFKHFDINIMTLGYPKSGDSDRILKLEHKGIEIRTGNPEWGAEPNKLYFVIKHGRIIA